MPFVHEQHKMGGIMIWVSVYFSAAVYYLICMFKAKKEKIAD